MRAKLCVILICLSSVLLSGCQTSRKIETASIIENVSISAEDSRVCYTFYILSSDEKPKGIRIPADSFGEARKLAESEYIPNLSLSKLELLLIEDSLSDRALESDIEYISTQPSFSPSAYVALCDRNTLEAFSRTAGGQRLIEEQLTLLKKNDPSVCVNYLSVFNRFASSKTKYFTVGYVTCDGEMKISAKKIEKTKAR